MSVKKQKKQALGANEEWERTSKMCLRFILEYTKKKMCTGTKIKQNIDILKKGQGKNEYIYI